MSNNYFKFSDNRLQENYKKAKQEKRKKKFFQISIVEMLVIS